MSVYSQYQPPASNGGLFLKLEDGETVRIRIASEPYIFNSEYQGNISTKYAWSVYNYEQRVGQVLQLSMTTFKQVQNLAKDEDWGDPTKYDIKITRTGTGTDTKYQLSPSPNKTPMTDEMKSETAKVDVEKAIKGAIPLAQVVAGKEVPKPSVNPFTADVVVKDLPNEPINLDDIPF